MASLLVVSNYRSLVSHRPEAEVFIELQQRGHKVTIMTYEDAYYIPRFREMGIKVIPYHPVKKTDRKARELIRELLLSENVELLFLFNNKSISNGIAAASAWKGKVILYRGCPGNIYFYDPTAYLKHLHPRVDYIICNSDAVKDHMDKALLWRKDKNYIIRKGHNPDWYNDVKPMPRQEFNVKDGDFILSFVGNDRRVKGIRYLLESTHFYEKDIPIHLFLFGSGLDQKKYLQIADKSPFRERIHFMGFKKNVIEWVAGSNALVLSSIEHESLTKSVIESMCVKTPVIITDIPGNEELLVHKDSGIKVPIKDGKAIYNAACELQQNEELQKNLSEQGAKRIKRTLSHEQTVRDYETFIKKITS